MTAMASAQMCGHSQLCRTIVRNNFGRHRPISTSTSPSGKRRPHNCTRASQLCRTIVERSHRPMAVGIKRRSYGCNGIRTNVRAFTIVSHNCKNYHRPKQAGINFHSAEWETRSAQLCEGFTIVSHNCEARSSTDGGRYQYIPVSRPRLHTTTAQSRMTDYSAHQTSTAGWLALRPTAQAHAARVKRNSPSGELKFTTVKVYNIKYIKWFIQVLFI
jgi:hypothetical protein